MLFFQISLGEIDTNWELKTTIITEMVLFHSVGLFR